jgi:hypothetical protein
VAREMQALFLGQEFEARGLVVNILEFHAANLVEGAEKGAFV